MEAGIASSAVSLTPCTDGVKPGGKKRQRPQSASGAIPPSEQTLRGFSLKVCHVVQTKQNTSYNEVAEALVDEIVGTGRTPEQENEARNVRRCAVVMPARH